MGNREFMFNDAKITENTIALNLDFTQTNKNN